MIKLYQVMSLRLEHLHNAQQSLEEVVAHTAKALAVQLLGRFAF